MLYIFFDTFCQANAEGIRLSINLIIYHCDEKVTIVGQNIGQIVREDMLNIRLTYVKSSESISPSEKQIPIYKYVLFAPVLLRFTNSY